MGQGSGLGGASLGQAHGTITIDTRDLSRVQGVARQVGQDVSRSLGQIDASAKRAEGGVGGLVGGIRGLGAAYGAMQAARFVLEADALATAYKRQSVAAVNLAGSQEELNKLLAAYDKATGGAIDKATALSDVLQLQAIGFADNAQELERFASAARGISIATGRSQDYVISQMQLAIANQSTMRLDQLGLGVSEVKAKIAELKREDRSLTDEMAYQNAILTIAEQKFGALTKSVEAQATGAEKAAKAWKNLKLTTGEALGPLTGAVMTGLSNEIEGISKRLQDVARDATIAGAALRGMNARSGATPYYPVPQDFLTHDYIGEGIGYLNRQMFGTPVTGPSSRPYGRTFGRATGPTEDPRAADRRNATLDFERQIQDIERSANEQRIDATRNYESQRSDTIREYEKTIAREAEDFALQRARAEADYQRQVTDLQADAAKRDARMESDYNDRVAELRTDSNKRLADIEEDYQKRRERAERDHKDRLFDAAARLDAVAVQNEQRNYARQQQDAKEAHDEQVSDLQDQLQERLAQEAKAHQERLQDAREADAERLEDMRQDFIRQREQEEEDRRIRLERMAEDHQDQLAEMDRAQGERLEQIARHEAEERKAAEEAHLQEMAELGVVLSKGWSLVQKSIEAQMLKDYEEFKKELERRFVQPRTDRLGNPQTPYIPQYATGGWVRESGLAMVHQGEYIANARQAASMVSNQSIGDISFQIYAAPGQSPNDIADAVDARLMSVFKGMLN